MARQDGAAAPNGSGCARNIIPSVKPECASARENGSAKFRHVSVHAHNLPGFCRALALLVLVNLGRSAYLGRTSYRDLQEHPTSIITLGLACIGQG